MDLKSSALLGSTMSMNDLNNISILWNKQGKRLHELMTSELRNSNDKSFLVKAHCKRPNCECALRNHKTLLLKAVYDVSFVYATWNKQKSVLDWKTNAPMADRQAQLVLPHNYEGWFEIYNENHQPIPCWINVKDVVRFRPHSFLVRKDMKALIQRPSSSVKSLSSSTSDLSGNQTTTIKAATVLQYIEYRKYNISKSKSKVKEVALVHCSDPTGRAVFLSIEEKCLLSPVAGRENISGVHNLKSVIRKFHPPLNIHPLFQAPMTGLSQSEKHFLRITDTFRGHLLFLAALDNPDKFFVVTASMLEDHNFFLGESTQPYHFHALEKHSKRVDTFLSTSHPQDSLRYLFKHLTNVKYTKSDGPQNNGIVRNGSYHSLSQSSETGNNREFDQDYIDVEEIYYFIRTGHYPSQRNRPGVTPTLTRPPPTPPRPQHIAERKARAITDPQAPPPVIINNTHLSNNNNNRKKKIISSSCDNLLEATRRDLDDGMSNSNRRTQSQNNSNGVPASDNQTFGSITPQKQISSQDGTFGLDQVAEEDEDLDKFKTHHNGEVILRTTDDVDKDDTRAEISQVVRHSGAGGRARRNAASRRVSRNNDPESFYRRYSADCSPLKYQRQNPSMYCSYEHL